ncbi:MAG: inorganic phosphate transporter, partial [Gammaproteobacteria bacterium]|nr:inorganic phosphate transporter [Gammaproteobacteria bacterium]
KMVEEIKAHHHGKDEAVVERFLIEFRKASVVKKGLMLQQLKEHSAKADLSKKERKGLKRVYKTELVKRSALMRIVAAWLITVPVSGLLAAMLFFTIRGFMLP